MFFSKDKIFYLILVVVCSVIFRLNVQAESTVGQFAKSFLGDYHYVDSNGKFADFEYFQRVSDGHIAYCIEPGVSLASDLYNGYFNLSMDELAAKVFLSKERLNEVSLIAYFGWGYNSHYGDEWIIATQALIWQVLGRSFQFTSRNSKANPWQYVIETPISIQDKINELKYLVNAYLKKPSFNINDIKVPYKGDLILTDENNVLSDYYVSNCINCNASINGNQLDISSTVNDNGEVFLKKETNNWQANFVVYENANGQNILVPGNLEPVEEKVNFSVVAGQVSLKKYDSKTNSCRVSSSYGSLKGAIYGIYTSDGLLVQELKINKSCSAVSKKDLELGKYYIQEIKAPKGYKLDLNKYWIDITMDNLNVNLVLKDEIYKTKLVIKKTYLEDNEIKLEPNAEFEIYSVKNNKLITVLKTNELGLANVTLSYGKYIIKQTKGKEGYHFVNDISLEVSEKSKEITNLNLINNPFRGTLELTKLDYVTNKLLENAEFEIYNDKGNLVYTGKTNENGKMIIKDIPYGKYYISEKMAPKGYAKSLKKIYFEIKENDEVIKIDVTNEQEVSVPNTYSNKNYDIYYILIIFLGLGLLFYEKIR